MEFTSARMTLGDWREAISMEIRKKLITDVFYELVRITGESDKQKVWQSAAKFELMLLLQSTDRMTYMSKLQRKIASLKKKVQPDAAGVSQQAPSQHQHLLGDKMEFTSARMTLGDWREAISMEIRKKLITDVFYELVRITGESDKQKVWQSAAKFELMLLLQSTDRMTYMSKLQRKIASLKKKVQPDAAGAPQQAPPQQHQQQQVQMNPQAQAKVAAAASMFQTLVNMSNFAPAAGQPVTDDTLRFGDKIKQLKAKYWGDLVVVCRAFTRLATQKPAGESQQALQQQERIKFFLQVLKRIMTLLNQDPTKHKTNYRCDLDRVELYIERQVMPILSRLKSNKAKQLNAKYWGDLVVVCRAFTRLATQKPAGESQQALQQQERIKFFLQVLKRIMTLLNQDPTKHKTNYRCDLDRVELYIERQVMPILSRLKSNKAKQLNAKYWGDLVVVCRAFTRLATQKPAGESQQALQQQERIKFFLQVLKRIMTLLNQDPTKHMTNYRCDLDRVELYIERQVMPILSRLKSNKAKQREGPTKTETPAPAAGPTPAELQRQTLLEAHRQNHMAQQKNAQEALLKAQKAVPIKVETEKQQQAQVAVVSPAATAAADQERKVKEEEVKKEITMN